MVKIFPGIVVSNLEWGQRLTINTVVWMSNESRTLELIAEEL